MVWSVRRSVSMEVGKRRTQMADRETEQRSGDSAGPEYVLYLGRFSTYGVSEWTTS